MSASRVPDRGGRSARGHVAVVHTLREHLALPGAVLALLLLGTASGCRSGAGAMSGNRWWSFGGTKGLSTFASKDGQPDPVKPSAVTAPYPTTGTPASYELAETAPASPATSQAVTYGATPPAPAPAAPAFVDAKPASAAAAPSAAGNATQVGPYAMLPAAAPVSPAPAAPSNAFPETAGYEPARPASPPVDTASRWTSPVPPAASPAPVSPAATETLPGSFAGAAAAAAPEGAVAGAVAAGTVADSHPGSRYAATTGSRFGGSPGASPAPEAFTPAPSSVPAMAPAAAPGVPEPAVAPAAVPTGPPPGLPASGTDPLRGIRRPDPGYRPGGTSSYQPGRVNLADAAAPADVRSAAYGLESTPPRDE
ncbi:MAG: hypothetical protein FJ309_15155 [Planctomycetes bacterium]|nr:hypothetical protein [Planctomycetota bacterium]